MLTRFSSALLMSLALAGSAWAADATNPPASDPVVAKVAGSEIHQSEVAQLYTQMPAQMRQLPLQTVFPMLVERLVEQRLLTDAGYAQKLQKTDAVKTEVHQAEEHAVARAYLEQKLDAAVTAQALQAAYGKMVADFKPETEVKASHILVDNEKEAKAIIAKLAKGGDFAKLAQEKSKDRGSAEKGGDLGYFTAAEMVEPFAKAAFAMKAGEVSKVPVKTDFGWHIIKVEDIRQTEKPKFEDAKAQLEQNLRETAVDGILKDLRKDAKVELFAPDGSKLPQAKADDKPAEAPAADKK